MAKQTFTTGQVLTAAQMTSLQQTAMLGGAASAKVASYTLVAADAGTAISMSNASATTITVNTGLFAAGDTVQITNLGAGVCTITAGTATVNTSASLALAQYESGTLTFTSTSAAIFIKGAGASTSASWTTFTPSFTNLTVGNATLTGKYLNINKTCIFYVQVVFGTTTSVGTAATLTLPVSAASIAASQGGIYNVSIQDSGIGTYIGSTQVLNNTATTLRWGGVNAGSTYATYQETTSSVPASWGQYDAIYISGMYEVA